MKKLANLIKAYYGIDISDIFHTYRIKNLKDFVAALQDEVDIWGI